MGTVYEATHLELGRRVAVKVLNDATPRAVARLRQEASAAARLGSPHIALVHELVARDDEPPVLVMELLAGESLAARLERETRLELGRAARIASQVLAALDVAHRAGIVHRDVKPSNVWLVDDARADGDAHVKLLDFGIATLPDEEGIHTTTGVLLGTPGYLAPEQLRGLPADARSDLHAVGLLLYVMVTGSLPWASAPRSVHLETLERVPAPLHELVPGVPPSLSVVVACALAKDPASRFATAAEMADALARAVAVATAAAPPPRRKRETTAIVAASATLAAVVAFGVTVAKVVAPVPDVAPPRPAPPAPPFVEEEPLPVTAPPPPSAIASATPKSCHCEGPHGALLCVREQPIRCACVGARGELCPTRPDASGRCPAGRLDMAFVFHGTEGCSGFGLGDAGGKEEGALESCNYCYATEQLTGRAGDACEGRDRAGGRVRRGFLVCAK